MSDPKLAQLFTDHVDTVRAHFDEALAAGGFEQVVIHSGSLHGQFLDDMPYPFKVNPLFKYWLPVTDNPECFVIYRPGDKPVLLFHRPVDFWHKVADAPKGFWTDAFDIRLLDDPAKAREHMDTARPTCLFAEEPRRFEWGFRSANPGEVLNHIHFRRTRKTAYEIESMREANRIAVAGHRAAEHVFREGGSEFDIYLAFSEATEQTQEDFPYHAIIALNEHASTLHYQALDRRPPAEHRTFLIDAGAQCRGYASDVTRTYTSDDGEFAGIMNQVEDLQKELCRRVRAGTSYPDLHLQAHRMIGDILEERRLVRLPGEAIAETGISSYFFPHGVGHFIGLQVHDVGGFLKDASGATIPQPDGHPFLRLTRTLEPGNVLTIEPGLYFIDSLLGDLEKSHHNRFIDWERVDRLRPWGGVRVEDDVVVTAGDPENLTRNAFDNAR